MCALCNAFKKRVATGKPLDADETRDYLEKIAVAIGKGRNPEHFANVTDTLLGTGMTESDEELDAAWENGRRG